MSRGLLCGKRSPLPSVELLRDRLTYNSETGELHWKANFGTAKAGGVAGTLGNRGYLSLVVKGKRMYAHRLAWILTHGAWPLQDIDHINGNRSDNRLINLRDVSRSVNLQNIRHARPDNRTGLIGVTFTQGRYRAAITLNRKVYYLGSYVLARDAHAAYLAAKREIHPGGML